MHTFACPVHALDRNLQTNKSIPRRNPRSHTGLNLDPSLRYARNENSILNSQTGTASTQFYVQCDDFYETEKEKEETVKGV